MRRLDGIRRQSAGISMAALDDILFSDESIVDCRCERDEDRLAITALTAGSPDESTILARVRALVPELSVSFSARPARADDRTLFPGKRNMKEHTGGSEACQE